MLYDMRTNLRAAISRSGLVIKEVASKSGVSKGTIDNWIGSNPTIPRATDAYAVAKALGTTVEFLVTGEHSAGWNPPARIAHVVADLELLDDPGLEAVTVLARGLASRIEHERRFASGGG